MELALVFVVFMVLFCLDVPIAIALGAASFIGILISPVPVQLSTVPTAAWQGLNLSLLLAVPLFLLLGNLALAGGITDRIIQWAGTFVGHLRGGLAQINVLVNIVMAGVSGSALSDTAATGSILIPAMKRKGYPAGYSAAITAGAASVGPIIPPSITLILVGAVTNTSVGRLFLAGAIPGLMLGLLLMVQAYRVAERHDFPREAKVEWGARVRTTFRVLPVLLLPLVVLGVIILGITTVTESAVIGVFAVAFLGFIVYRQVTPSRLTAQLYETVRGTASIFFLLAMASAFAQVLALYGAPAALADWISTSTTNPLVFLFGIVVVYLLLGMFLEPVPIILVFVPLLTSTVIELGIEPLHFGVITVFALVIGLLTPPFGLGMFLVCRIARIEIDEYFRWAWPIVLLMIFGVVLVILFPQLTTVLPDLLLPLP